MRDKLVNNLGSGRSRFELSLSPEMGLIHHYARTVQFYKVLQPSQSEVSAHARKSVLKINVWPSEKDGVQTQITYFCCPTEISTLDIIMGCNYQAILVIYCVVTNQPKMEQPKTIELNYLIVPGESGILHGVVRFSASGVFMRLYLGVGWSDSLKWRLSWERIPFQAYLHGVCKIRFLKGCWTGDPSF